MQNDNHTFREPKQERSRQSFDKALDAAVALTVERRSDAWTLAEVARRAGVSTGSIYGRVDSKDDLIHTAQAREMVRIRVAQRQAFGAPVPAGEAFRDAVARVIRTLAGVLRTEAPVLAPFMLIGGRDRVVAEEGKRGFEELVRLFCAGLLARRNDIRHPEPERAVSWSFTVVYSVLARWLGLGSDPEAAGEGDWEQILADLSEMVTTFLGGPGGDAAEG
ncbi:MULTISPECIES: TetR/AcrR family transcriptional regulator [Streptomyces]|uniref:TetR/AcrR family transcriptional regulator n=1 Tax=Streptomyces heilongjiangensis TaxID=945052 RepID=A0ABW1BJX2_9ACTN|nr:TetR/AcrR family transcriptional regulator [Streptomyces heilongjiangensis]MDC2951956.1 TetR/AcrR family transcriptional regulator [Streptomyces heilongjiangensis]